MPASRRLLTATACLALCVPAAPAPAADKVIYIDQTLLGDWSNPDNWMLFPPGDWGINPPGSSPSRMRTTARPDCSGATRPT